LSTGHWCITPNDYSLNGTPKFSSAVCGGPMKSGDDPGLLPHRRMATMKPMTVKELSAKLKAEKAAKRTQAKKP
jgi:hypothetical protein